MRTDTITQGPPQHTGPHRRNPYRGHHTAPPHRAPHRPPPTAPAPGDHRAGPARTHTDRHTAPLRTNTKWPPPFSPPHVGGAPAPRTDAPPPRAHLATARRLLLGFQTSPPARSANEDPRPHGRQSAPAVGQRGRGLSPRSPPPCPACPGGRGVRARLPAGFARGSAPRPSGREGKMAAGTGSECGARRERRRGPGGRRRGSGSGGGAGAVGREQGNFLRRIERGRREGAGPTVARGRVGPTDAGRGGAAGVWRGEGAGLAEAWRGALPARRAPALAPLSRQSTSC